MAKPVSIKNPDGSIRLWRQFVELPAGPDGKRRRKALSAKRKSDLSVKVREFEATLYRSGGDVATNSPAMSEWVETWIKAGESTGDLRPKTAKEYRGYVRRYITPSIGGVKVGKITPAHIRRLRAYIMDDQGLSPSTALQAHNIVSGALKMAVEDGMVPDNAARKTKRPQAADYQATTLTLAQARQLLKWAGREIDNGNWWAIRIPLALYAGLRQGETLGLTRQFVHFDYDEDGESTSDSTLEVGYALQSIDGVPHKSLRVHHVGGRQWLLPPKSKSGLRAVPMVKPLRMVIAARLESMTDDPWAPIVPAPEGGFLDYSRDYKMWQAALKAAGVPKVRVHDGRHTTGTLLRAAGVEPRIIQVILGHNSAAMTEHYSHVGRDEARTSVESYESYMLEG